MPPEDAAQLKDAEPRHRADSGIVNPGRQKMFIGVMTKKYIYLRSFVMPQFIIRELKINK